MFLCHRNDRISQVMDLQHEKRDLRDFVSTQFTYLTDFLKPCGFVTST